jgi:hypothetical protein
LPFKMSLKKNLLKQANKVNESNGPKAGLRKQLRS